MVPVVLVLESYWCKYLLGNYVAMLFCVAKVENVLLKEDGNYVLCDYGSCSLETLIPEVCVCVSIDVCSYSWVWLL